MGILSRKFRGLVVAVAISTVLAGGAFAYTKTQPGGAGTEADPYRIENLSNLTWLMETTSAWAAGKYILLTADIDASVTSTWTDTVNGFWGVGTNANPFNGVFNGNGKTISGIYMNQPSSDYIGFFRYIGTGTVRSLNLSGVAITGRNDVGGLSGYNSTGSVYDVTVSGSVTGNNNVGGLTGDVGQITQNCSTSGTVTGVTEVGGISGNMGGGTKLYNCSSSMTVTATGNYAGGLVGYGCEMEKSRFTGTVTGLDYVGGIVGYHDCDEGIYSSYSTGSVTGRNRVGGVMGEGNGPLWESFATGKVTGTGARVGGLAGVNYRGIRDSYATGEVSGASEVGGLIGWNWNGNSTSNKADVTNCYSSGKVTGTESATTGGLIGKYESGTVYSLITSSYWDKTKSTQNASAGGTGKTTAQMAMQATYSGWNFTSLWVIEEGGTTPFFHWQIADSGDSGGVGLCFIEALR